MSDTTNITPSNTEQSQGTNSSPTTVEVSAPTKEPSKEELLTKAQVEDMLTKARKEEKDKLYKSLEKAKLEAKTLQSERDKVLEDLNSAKDRLQTLQDSNMSDIEKVNRQIDLLAEQNELLKKQVESVSLQAEKRLRDSELKSYRDQQIKASGLLFPELVEGQSREEIDASINKLLEREQSVRSEIEDKIRGEAAVNVPRPMSPEVSSPNTSVGDRYRISKMSRDEYSAYRQKLMSKAMDSIRK